MVQAHQEHSDVNNPHPSLILNIDGGSRGNPGPAGAGVVLRDAGGRVVAHLGAFLGRATNNVAEYSGLIAGLKKAAELAARRVKVYSDSQLLVYQMTGRYRVKNPALAGLLLEAKGLESKFDRVDYQHIPREQNAIADGLANQAMDARKSFEKNFGSLASESSIRPRRQVGDPPPDKNGAGVVVCLQTDITWEDKLANFAHVSGMLAGAALAPGSLVVLPEMFATGFSMNLEAIAQGEAREDERFLAEAARRYRCTLLGGVVIRDGGKCRNQAVAFGPDGGEIARFTKLHPFTFANEHLFFTPGEAPALFDWSGVKVAPLICYDLRFPEAFRQAARRGAEVLAVLANWPKAREHHWQAMLAARAMENQAFVVGVNRVGKSPADEYNGGSVILDPDGRTLAGAGAEEGAIEAALDIPAMREYRRKFPVLADIRPDLLP